jgi:predicted transcriptional regulator
MVHNLKAQKRRKMIVSLLAQARTEEELAAELKVTQGTISRDIKALKILSQKYIYNLAKADLAFYYTQCLNGISEVKRKCWDIYRDDTNNTKPYPIHTKLSALKLAKECDEAKFNLFKEGPAVMNMTALEARLSKIELQS